MLGRSVSPLPQSGRLDVPKLGADRNTITDRRRLIAVETSGTVPLDSVRLKAYTDPFYKPSKSRGVVPCEEWDYFVIHELKGVTVRLLGPPIRTPDERYAIHCFDRIDGKLKVLEGPHELFEEFAVYAQKSGHSASGPEAPDFRVAFAARPFRYFVTPLALTTLTYAQQVEMVCSCLNLGKIYKTGQDMHIVQVTMRLGVWPKPVWPTKYQEAANAAGPDRLAADGVIIRFPSRSELA